MERSGALGNTHLMCGSWDAIVRISLLFENSRPSSPSPYEHVKDEYVLLAVVTTRT